MPAHLNLLLVAWLAYFLLHSALASLAIKTRVAARWPGLMPAYRLGFNLMAVLTLLPILWLTYRQPGELLWHWSGAWSWLADGLALAAVAGVLHTLRDYDLLEFLGWRQWKNRTRSVADQERFHISPAHRFVRHPWYFYALVLLWTRDLDAARLLTTVLVSAYFLIGSKLEERKLIAYHGERYRQYMTRVAGLLPLPWKVLSKAEAAALVGMETGSQ
jgi:protein-S-isoprenylcysteine O-methyltransferase Ste14